MGGSAPSAYDGCYCTCGDMCGTLAISEYTVIVVGTNFKLHSTVMCC